MVQYFAMQHLLILWITCAFCTMVTVSQSTSQNWSANLMNVSSCSSCQFQCANKLQCINIDQKCDGKKNCEDNSDEENCDLNDCDLFSHFTCSNGTCLPNLLKCDGNEDCLDGLDEACCINKLQCEKDQFFCGDGKCISKNSVCDQVFDCPNKSDEKDCKYPCKENEFRCFADEKAPCLPNFLRCNGEIDCQNESDEENCPSNSYKQKSFLNNTKCDSTQFRCKSGECIDSFRMCDGIQNCKDNSDESPDCSKDACLLAKERNNMNCSHFCKSESLIARCFCKDGFRLAEDGFSCEDEDECTNVPGYCSGHHCENLPNGQQAKCKCAPHYDLLSNGTKCKLPHFNKAKLLFSHYNDFRAIPQNSNLLTRGNAEAPFDFLYNGLNGISAFDLHWANKKIYWFNVAEQAVYQGSFTPLLNNNITNLETPQLLLNDVYAEQLALDFAHDLLYWTDSQNDCIKVASLQSPYLRHTLINTTNEKPYGIALLVQERLMVWSTLTKSGGKLIRASQHGTNQKVLISDPSWILEPLRIALDSASRSVYWIDKSTHAIAWISVDGGTPHRVYQSNINIVAPQALDVLGDYVYWSDTENSTIYTAPRLTSVYHNSQMQILVQVTGKVLGIRLLHEGRQWFDGNKSKCLPSCNLMCLPSTNASGVCVEGQANSDIIFNSLSEQEIEQIVSKARGILFFIVLLCTSIIFVMAMIYYLTRLNKSSRRIDLGNGVYQPTTQQKISKKYSHDELSHTLQPLNPNGTNNFV